MKLLNDRRRRGEGGLAIWIIILAILGGAVWFLYSSRRDAEKQAKNFAEKIVKTMAVDCDTRFLNANMTPSAQVNYIPSWRDRMVGYLKGFGPMAKPIETTGDVSFSSVFFDPHGRFKSVLTYSNMTATMNVAVVPGMKNWQVDELNLLTTPP